MGGDRGRSRAVDISGDFRSAVSGGVVGSLLGGRGSRRRVSQLNGAGQTPLEFAILVKNRMAVQAPITEEARRLDNKGDGILTTAKKQTKIG